jgi:hypothetical protein
MASAFASTILAQLAKSVSSSCQARMNLVEFCRKRSVSRLNKEPLVMNRLEVQSIPDFHPKFPYPKNGTLPLACGGRLRSFYFPLQHDSP